MMLVLALLVSGAVGTLFGMQRERDHWKPLYGQAAADVKHWESESEDWHQSSDANQLSSDRYQATSHGFQTRLSNLQAKVLDSVGDLDHPSFALWNSCGAAGPLAGCPLSPGHEYIGGVPDTFTYYVSFRSTVPVTVWIMSSSNFVCWETHYCAWRAVGWENRTHLEDGVFHGAEGCAGYFVVFFSSQSGTLFPGVRITRKPASHPTGVCA